MKKAYRNLEPEDFIKLVVEHTGLSKVELVGDDRKNRKIYKLTA